AALWHLLGPRCKNRVGAFLSVDSAALRVWCAHVLESRPEEAKADEKGARYPRRHGVTVGAIVLIVHGGRATLEPAAPEVSSISSALVAAVFWALGRKN